MPRSARTVLVNYPLHIVQRGINRNRCFFGDGDYAAYLRYLGIYAGRFGCSIHAYCLMTNHVHLLVTPHAEAACALLMKNVGQCFVQRVNKALKRTGTLWEGRFHSCLVRSDSHVLACYRYIELNPVRAAMVRAPGEYPWSSYGANAHGAANGLVQPHGVYEQLGADAASRASAYGELCAGELSSLLLEEIRRATRAGCVMGTLRRNRGRPPLTR
jgi:putative transposase